MTNNIALFCKNRDKILGTLVGLDAVPSRELQSNKLAFTQSLSALERFDQINILLHGVFLRDALHLGPGIVLGAANQIGEARALAFDITA